MTLSQLFIVLITCNMSPPVASSVSSLFTRHAATRCPRCSAPCHLMLPHVVHLMFLLLSMSWSRAHPIHSLRTRTRGPTGRGKGVTESQLSISVTCRPQTLYKSLVGIGWASSSRTRPPGTVTVTLTQTHSFSSVADAGSRPTKPPLTQSQQPTNQLIRGSM